METKTLQNTEAEIKSLIASIITHILQAINMKKIESIISRNIQKKYQIGMDELELKFNMNFTRDTERVQFLETYAFENIKGMTDEISQKLRKELTESVMNLESVIDLATRIKKVMDISKERAVMIARTETTRAENQGKYDAAIQSGLKLKKYVDATRDNRTSDICIAMDEKYGSPEKAIDMDKKFTVTVKGKVISDFLSPFHPNCRTTIMYEQQDE